MSDHSSDVDFKHDTDNLTAFTVILFSVTGVMFVIAACLLVFRIGTDHEMERKVYKQPSTRDAAMVEHAQKRLELTRPVRDTAEGVATTWNIPLERSLQQVLQEGRR